VTFAVEILDTGSYALEAAARIALSLPGEGSAVLTGGTTVRPVYEALADSDVGWGSIDVYFSDERCVPPEDSRSNYGMARRALLDPVGAPRVHRMKGESNPIEAADRYHEQVAAAPGFDLALLSVGLEGHVAGLFPGARALEEAGRLCVSVERPDGMLGLTLTPPALRPAARVLLLGVGGAKADVVWRALTGDEAPTACPVRMFADHPDATFILDREAGARL
jgi:6-phosphogluconolactonase